MAVASWILRRRSSKTSGHLLGRRENNDDAVNLDYSRDAGKLMQEILYNVCLKREISRLKKLNYLNSFVELLSKDVNWKPMETFGFTMQDLLTCLRVALIQDCVQVRAAALRAIRYVIKTPENVVCLNGLHIPYLIARSLDLILTTDNERILMNERIQALRLIRHILATAPQHFVAVLVRPLVAIVLRPHEETDRLLRACIAVLCEICILNTRLFTECDGINALLRNINLINSAHMGEAICAALLFILNKPNTRHYAQIDLDYMASFYTSGNYSVRARSEDQEFFSMNIIMLSLLRSWPGLLHFCHPGDPLNPSGLRSIIETLHSTNSDTSKAILDMLFELINATIPDWTSDINVALRSVDPCRFQESFRLSEGFVLTESKEIFSHTSPRRLNLVDVHLAVILFCLVKAGLADTLVELMVNGDPYLSTRATILLGQFLHLIDKYLSPGCDFTYPTLSNLISYSVRGCPIFLPYHHHHSYRRHELLTNKNLNISTKKTFKNKRNSPKKDKPKSGDSIVSESQYISSDFIADIDKHSDLQCSSDTTVSDMFDKLKKSTDLSSPPLSIDRNNIIDEQSTTECDSEFIDKQSIDNMDDQVGNDGNFINNNNNRLSKDDNKIQRDYLFEEGEISDSILNVHHKEWPCSKIKQQKALSAINSLCKLHKILSKPVEPSTMFLANIIRNVDVTKIKIPNLKRNSFVVPKLSHFKKINQTWSKQLDLLIKESLLLLVDDSLSWKWESIRAALKIYGDGYKKLNNSSFKALLKRLIMFYKPSSMQFSQTDLKAENGKPNLPSLTCCDLLDFLLDTDNTECNKFLNEFLEDVELHLNVVVNAKSVHTCLFSPQHLMNSLCQDYFLFIGRLAGTDEGLVALQQTRIMHHLNQIASTTNLDCYIKLIVSNLSCAQDASTRKILSSVMSNKFVSSRIYAIRFMHMLLRFKITLEFGKWLIELLVTQLYDENDAISLAAVTALDEAADNRDYLEFIIELRPTLLHLGDKGLSLLIRFLSTEQGFNYLQMANFINPQLQRWASSYNCRYVQIMEGELHDSLTTYQREDGIYRRRLSDHKPIIKPVFVLPHLYGQLAQHSNGFNLLKEQDTFHRMIKIVLNGSVNTDESILQMKSALWSLGHVGSSILGVKYLSELKVIESIMKYAENCCIYSVKATALYVLSMFATTAIGVSELSMRGWICVKLNLADGLYCNESLFQTCMSSMMPKYDAIHSSHTTECTITPQNDSTDLNDDAIVQSQTTAGGRKKENVSAEASSYEPIMLRYLSLPRRNQFVQRKRTSSESREFDIYDDWSLSGSPTSNLNKIITDPPRLGEEQKRYEDSCTDSTSGISSCDSVSGKPPNINEKIQTLSPIPSSSSITTVVANSQNILRPHLIKRHSSISFGCRLSAQTAMRMLHPNRHRFGSGSSCSSSSLSASATIDLLTEQDRRQMSPLIRPKFSRYVHPPLYHEFEVKETPFHVIDTDSLHYQSLGNTEHDKNRHPCICLPAKLSNIFPEEIIKKKHTASERIATPPPSNPTKPAEETEGWSADSDVEIPQTGGVDHKVGGTGSARKRRHNRLNCLLCSTRVNTTGRRMSSRRTSITSIHRTRTDTESSYGGGGTGPELESPILLGWQQKPVGLINTAGTGFSSSTATTDTPSFPHQQCIFVSENNTVKSRSLLRKEVLKIIEQLGNPILYRTCKQGLFQLKQLCGDLFQDVCLFSDVSLLLGKINYRIQARQLIQDLFVDAPFFELYDEPFVILERIKEINADLKPICCTPIETTSSYQQQHKPKTPKHLAMTVVQDSKQHHDESQASTNFQLEVIIETDSKSDNGSGSSQLVFGSQVVRNSFIDCSQIGSSSFMKSSTPNQSQQNLNVIEFPTNISSFSNYDPDNPTVLNLNDGECQDLNELVPNHNFKLSDSNFLEFDDGNNTKIDNAQNENHLTNINPKNHNCSDDNKNNNSSKPNLKTDFSEIIVDQRSEFCQINIAKNENFELTKSLDQNLLDNNDGND